MESQARTRNRRNWILALRFVILAFGLAAGVLLLERGDLVLGAVIVTWVVLRFTLLLSVLRRRRRWSARFRAPGA
jgi:hypothetical protein